MRHPTPLGPETLLALARLLKPGGPALEDAHAARLSFKGSGFAHSPGWPGSLDWHQIYQLATAHLVAPMLFAILSERGQLNAAPPPVRGALAELHRLNRERNARLTRVLRDTLHHLNAAGLEPLLLKGSVALLPDQPPHAATRMLSDLDLALQNAEAEAAEAVLRAVGYVDAENCDPAWYQAPFHHLPPLFHPSGEAYVELHRTLLTNRLPAQTLPLETVRAAAEPFDWDGLRLWRPSLEHRLLHNALHHQAQNDAFRSDRRDLRQLLEFAQLRTLPGALSIDWPQRLAELDSLGLGEALRAYLLAVERLFEQPLPPGVKPGLAARWAEHRFWLTRRYPHLRRVFGFARRLPNLPRRLITPSWYPAKARALYQRWKAPQG